MKPRFNNPFLSTICLVLSLAGSHTLQAQTSIQNLNPAAVTQTVSSTTGSATLTVADGTAYSVGDIIRFTDGGNTSPFGGAANYYIVSVSGNDLQVSTTPGGAAVNATETQAAGATQLSQDLSAAATWTGGNVPDDNSERMVFSSTSGSVPAFIVTQDQTIYGLSYTGSGSDFVLASGADGTGLHTLTFATNDASTPKISFNSTSRIVRFGTGNGEALKIGGTQGLIFDGRTGGALTGTGVDATSANPSKNFRLSEVDWSEFSGGVTLERGEINIQGTAGNLPTNQTLTVGNAQTTTNNTLAHLAMGNFGQTVDGLNGTSLGRISGNSTLSVGNSNGSGDYAGVIGRGMTAGDTATNLTKNGTGTQTISGIMVGGGSITVNGGTLEMNGNNTFSGGVTGIASGATLKVGHVNGLGAGTIIAPFQGTLDVNGFGITNSIADKAINNGTISNTGAAVDLTGMGEIGATATRTMNLDGTGDMTFGQQITGSYNVVKNGINTVTLTGANTYVNTTVISGGTLQLGDGGTTGSLNTGSVITNDGNLTFNRSNDVDQGVDFSGADISGSGTITQSGSGATRLNTANSYTGGTIIESGILVATDAGALGTGTLTINGGRFVTSNVDISNNVVVGGDFAFGAESSGVSSASGLDLFGTVDLGGADRTITVRRTTTLNGAVSNGGLTFAGVGSGDSADSGRSLTLNGVNDYAGATTITSGTLVLGASGSIDNTSGVSLGTNGTFDVSAKVGGYTVNKLTGSGTVVGSLTVSTELAIGNSPGTTDFENLTLGASSVYTYELTGGDSTADLGNVSGVLTIDSGAILDLVQLGTYTGGDKFTLFAYQTGTLTGTFAGLADGANFTDAGGDWQIDYFDTSPGLNGGIGTSFVTVTAVPEPTAALLGSLGLLALLRRRRA